MKNNNLVGQFLCTLLLLSGISQASRADWMLEERFKSVQQLANAGKVQAMYELSRMFERGRGTTMNINQAAEWYKRASAAGNVTAKARLGILYFEGRGVPQNHQTAYQLLKEAAKADIPAAQYQLGLKYEWGTFVSQNKRLAMKWYEKARQGGDYRAQDKIAQLRTQRDSPLAGPRRTNNDSPLPAILNGK